MGSLSIVGVEFVKIPPHLFDMNTFYVWFQVLLILGMPISLRITDHSPGSGGPGTVFKLLDSAVQGIYNPVIEFPLLLTVGLHLLI